MGNTSLDFVLSQVFVTGPIIQSLLNESPFSLNKSGRFKGIRTLFITLNLCIQITLNLCNTNI